MEDFIPFEIAVKLKEKGFREECLLHYTDTGSLFSNSIDTYDRPNQELDYSDFRKCFNNGNSIGLVDAPTLSQVLKWLREKEISIEPCATPYSYWYYMIKEKGTIKVTYTGENYNNYEQAAIAGVNYCLDKLI